MNSNECFFNNKATVCILWICSTAPPLIDYMTRSLCTPPPSNQIVFDFISISFGTNLKGVVQPKGKYFYNLLVFILFQILETFIYLFKKKCVHPLKVPHFLALNG